MYVASLVCTTCASLPARSLPNCCSQRGRCALAVCCPRQSSGPGGVHSTIMHDEESLWHYAHPHLQPATCLEQLSANLTFSTRSARPVHLCDVYDVDPSDGAGAGVTHDPREVRGPRSRRWERSARHVVLHVLPGTLGICARRLLPSKESSWTGSSARHDGHPWRRAHAAPDNAFSENDMGKGAYRAGEGKRGRGGGSERAATARAVRSALLRDQHPCIHAPRDSPSPHDLRPPVGRGKPPTRGACAVLSSAAHERKGSSGAPLRGTTLVGMRRRGVEQAYDAGETALNTPVS